MDTKALKEFQEQAKEAIDLAQQNTEGNDTATVKDYIKASFEAVGYTVQDMHYGDIRNALILSKGKVIIALIYTDGDITKEDVTNAYRMRARLKLKQCAVATYGNAPEQFKNVVLAGGKVSQKMRNKDQFNRVFQYFLLR